jgi:spore germination protein YaaH
LKKLKKIIIMGICVSIISSLFTGLKAKAAEYKFNMSYIFFSDASEYTQLVDNTQDSLNEVSPNYFSLNDNGGLVLTSTVRADFVADMHNRGIKVVPFLTNDWSRSVGEAALNNRTALSKSLADAVSVYNLDGVNIDIENVTQTQRANYIDFVRLLRAQLPMGKEIVVSVAANPYNWTTGWQGSYDYTALSAYCDYLMVMAYDEHYYGGPSGPISSLSYIDKSIQYALSYVPKEKIVLGLPFYGRIWSNSGGFPDGYGVTNAKIAQLVKNYGGSVQVDTSSQSTRAVITISPGDAKPIIGGQALDAGTYTIWYESEKSIKAKLELISKYDIKGTGSWALGQETGNTWTYYKLWLNNCTFSDIQNNPAKNYILDAYMKKLIDGCTSAAFSPDEPLTRAQAATIIVRWLGLAVQANPSYSFDDCVGSWAESYLETARKYNIIMGIGGNLFAPDKPVTREEIAVMMNRALIYQSKGSVSTAPNVTDVSNTRFNNNVQALGANGSVTVLLCATLQPHTTITRADAVVFFAQLPSPASLPSGQPINLPT